MIILKGILRKLSMLKTLNIILSFIIAVVLWYFISISVYPMAPKTIRDVQVIIDLTGTMAETNNLQVVSKNFETVNVQIQGDRSQIGNLKASDITAKVKAENVVKSGEYELDLEITEKNGIKFDVTSITPSKIMVVFDVYETRTFDVIVQAPNITANQNMNLYMQELKCTPNKININGPRSQLENIDTCIAYIESELVLEDSYTSKTSNIVLKDSNEVELDKSLFSFETTEFTVDIPVYKRAEWKLTYELRNVPKNFDKSILTQLLELSEDTIQVAAPKNVLTGKTELNIGYIDVNEINLKRNFTFDIELPKNYINLSNITTVTAKLESESLKNLKSKAITINKSNFKVINLPSGMEPAVITENLSFEIFGPSADIDKIDETDIIIEIDLTDGYDLNAAFDKTVSIIIPNYPKVWASGNPEGGSHKVVVELSRTEE